MIKRIVALVLCALAPLALTGCMVRPYYARQWYGGSWFASGCLSVCLFVLYIWLALTVAVITFRKGHTVLGCLGFFLPLLWLIGALLPPKRGSSYWLEESQRHQL